RCGHERLGDHAPGLGPRGCDGTDAAGEGGKSQQTHGALHMHDSSRHTDDIPTPAVTHRRRGASLTCLPPLGSWTCSGRERRLAPASPDAYSVPPKAEGGKGSSRLPRTFDLPDVRRAVREEGDGAPRKETRPGRPGRARVA